MFKGFLQSALYGIRQTRCDIQGEPVSENIRNFVENHRTGSRQLTMRFASAF